MDRYKEFQQSGFYKDFEKIKKKIKQIEKIRLDEVDTGIFDGIREKVDLIEKHINEIRWGLISKKDLDSLNFFNEPSNTINNLDNYFSSRSSLHLGSVSTSLDMILMRIDTGLPTFEAIFRRMRKFKK